MPTKYITSICGVIAAVSITVNGCSIAGDLTQPVYDKGIYLRGSMNDWSTANPLSYEGNGIYSVIRKLPPGDFEFKIADDTWSPGTNFGAGSTPQVTLGTAIPAVNGSDANFSISIATSGKYQFTFDATQKTEPKILVAEATAATEAKAAAASSANCPAWNKQPVSVDVSKFFADGVELQDALSGNNAAVKDGKVTLSPASDSHGLLLLEAKNSKPAPFSWQNATIYFVMTDRFANGDPKNDNSYGRKKDGKEEIGTFHGGDLVGLTSKLDYIRDLGANAIWITAPYEQVHGWVGGGDGDFQNYAYHGYWALDYTQVDANMGTETDLQKFVDAAHARGIRVLFDIVMNHPGYGTLQDMQELGFGSLYVDSPVGKLKNWGDWKPADGENWHEYHKSKDYRHPGWAHWWGPQWIRAGLSGDYDKPPSIEGDPLQGSLNYLPDFKTESKTAVKLPDFFSVKTTKAVNLENTTPRGYLISWLTDWVKKYGIDGFRVDTVKHVEPEAWAELKTSASAALKAWKSANASSKLDDQDFWMVGEVFGHGVNKDYYFDNGFDALINFDFQNHDVSQAAECFAKEERVFKAYAKQLNGLERFNMLSYISSHDTSLYSERIEGAPQQQAMAAANLLLLPGAVQIFYGDESARQVGPSGSDPYQGTRSDMNWADIDSGKVKSTVDFWRKLGQFRKRHIAIGAGTHEKIKGNDYAFARVYDQGGISDKVVVVYAGAVQ